MSNATKRDSSGPTPAVVYKLRDISGDMVRAWEHCFSEYPDGVQVSVMFLTGTFREINFRNAVITGTTLLLLTVGKRDKKSHFPL